MDGGMEGWRVHVDGMMMNNGNGNENVMMMSTNTVSVSRPDAH